MAISEEKLLLKDAVVMVTGACGFIGSHLVTRLLAQGVKKIVAVDSLEFGKRENLPYDSRILLIEHKLGTHDIAELEPHMRGITHLFHLAAYKHNQSKDSPEQIYSSNITGTHRLYEAAVKAGVKKIVFSSSLYANGRMTLPPMTEDDYPMPRTAYGMSKLAGENLLNHFQHEHNVQTVSLRFFFVYGPKQFPGTGYKSVIVKNFERILQNKPPIIFGSGNQSLDYVYIDDMVEAIVRAGESEKVSGKVINLGSGKATSVNELTQTMLAVADSNLDPVYELADWTEGTVRVSDSSKAAMLLDWRPQIDLRTGLRHTYEWIKKVNEVRQPSGISRDISIIAPCFNEEKNIPELAVRLVKVLEKKNLKGEIILVNDCSTDKTGEIIEKYARLYPNVVIHLDHTKNQGMFQAWKTGLKAARGEYVCLIDSDLQNLPEDVWRLYKEINNHHYDMVQGNRSTIGRLKDSRYILSRGLNWLLNTAFGMNSRDNKSGFVITRKETLEDILGFNYRGYFYPQSFIAVSAHAKGYSIKEIETLFQSRLLGESFITKNPLKPVILSFYDLYKAFLEFRLFFKKESILSNFMAEHRPLKYDQPFTWWRKILIDIYFMTLPLHTWMIGRNTQKYYYELKQSQWLSKKDIRELQEKKLRRLIHQAYNHVEYYRQLFDSLNLKPKDIQTINDLQKLPFLTKSHVRENLYFDLLSDNHDKRLILRISTSGSTGEPFVCYADRHQLEMRWAATLRSMEWTGYRFGDRQMRLWHQTLGMSFMQVVKERFDALLSRRLFIPAYSMTGKNIEKFIKKLKRYKPVLIDGYAESFNFLAKYIKDTNIKNLPSPKGIISSAQVLPEHSREAIESAFKTRVFDKYGSREFSGIAYESDGHDGHLVVAENYIVEIIKDGRPALPGEVGEVIITDLNNYCMPFIRYRVGDLAVAMDDSTPSPCGRHLPRIGTIEGRIQSIIVGANGNHVPGTFFAHLFKDYDHIVRQYKVIQEKEGEIILQIVKALRFDEDELKKITTVLIETLGHNTKIDIIYMEEIPMVRTGKQQGSVSRLQIDFQKINKDLYRKRML